MRRRTFLTSLGAASTSLFAGVPRVQAQRARIPVIGVLALGNPPPDTFLKALRAGMQQVGYNEDRNIRLDIRIADGSNQRLAQQAAELVATKVDVIVAYQTPAATVARQQPAISLSLLYLAQRAIQSAPVLSRAMHAPGEI